MLTNCLLSSMTRIAPICLLLVYGIFAYSAACAEQNSLRHLFQRPDQSVVYFDLELAASFEQRRQGLMWRESLQPRTGMLFDFDKESKIRMWMKNTLLPLDMIFLDKKKYIVHIHRGAVPGSLKIIETPHDARFTVELNAGEVSEYELSLGDRLFRER